jgi:hypothetical protein
MVNATSTEEYAENLHPGEREDQRAVEHRGQALDALDALEPQVALVHALLSIAERVSELSAFVARLS